MRRRLLGRWAPLGAAVPFIALGSTCRSAPLPETEVHPEREAAAETRTQEKEVVPADLLGTSWRLIRLSGQDTDLALPDITLAFEGDKAVGMGGCNRYTGWIEEMGNGRIAIGALAATRKACPSRIMDRETRYFATLEGASRYELSSEHLTLDYATEGETGRLEFEAASSEAD